MKKIFIYFLSACFLSLFHCSGIDEGGRQFSIEEDNPPPNDETEGLTDHRIAEGTTPLNIAPTDIPSVEGPRERRLPDSNEEGLTVTLNEIEETEEITEYSINLPLTYICIRDQTVATYYLYVPGVDDHLCDLHYSGTSKFWFAKFESDFCEKKLLEAVNERIQGGYTCYCGRPGGPEGIVNLIDGGHQCGS